MMSSDQQHHRDAQVEFWDELASDIQKELNALPVEEESPDRVAKRAAKLRAAYVVVRCNELLQEHPKLAPAWSAISAFCQSTVPCGSDLEFFNACFGAMMSKDVTSVPKQLAVLCRRHQKMDLADSLSAAINAESQSNLCYSDLPNRSSFEDECANIGALIVEKSYTDPSVREAAEKLLNRCETTGESKFPAFHILWQYHIVRSDYDYAFELARNMDHEAQSQADHAHAKCALGECKFYVGEFEQALVYLGHETVQNYSDCQNLPEPLGLDPRVLALGHASLAHAIRGCLDKAIDYTIKAIDVAEKREHLASRVFAQHCDAVLNVLRDDPNKAAEKAHVYQEIAKRLPFAIFEALARLIAGWANVKTGTDVSRVEIYAPLSQLRAGHQKIARALWLGMMAECELIWEEYTLARNLLDEAEEVRYDSGEAFYAPEIFRLKARVIAADSSTANQRAASTEFLRAIELARTQGASLYQLRSAVEYHQYVTHAADRAKAREAIREAMPGVLGDCKEVIEAREILETFSSKPHNRT